LADHRYVQFIDTTVAAAGKCGKEIVNKCAIVNIVLICQYSWLVADTEIKLLLIATQLSNLLYGLWR
jgi:hypothetical protein